MGEGYLKKIPWHNGRYSDLLVKHHGIKWYFVSMEECKHYKAYSIVLLRPEK